MSFVTQAKAKEIANTVLAAHEVMPLTHDQKCQRVSDELVEQGFEAKKSLVLMIVKLVNLGWHNTVKSTKQSVEHSRYRAHNDGREWNKKHSFDRYKERGE